jgi:hypothetical protein
MLTVATDIADVMSVHCYYDNNSYESIADVSNAHYHCAFTGLVPPHSPKLGVSYLKTEAHRFVSNLVTMPRVRVRERLRGFVEVVRAFRQ